MGRVLAGDVDADGDLDLGPGGVPGSIFGGSGQSRLLLNDGSGVFTEVTVTRSLISGVKGIHFVA